MKKIMLLTALAATCLCLASCEDEKEKIEVTPASLLSFSFTQENNPDVLTKDVTISNPQSGILKVEFPVGTSKDLMKALVPSFETSEEEAIVTIDGTEVISGTSVCDFSYDVDLYVTYRGITTNYVISVFAKEELSWRLIAENTDSTYNNRPEMVVNPVDNKVYIITSMPNAGEQKQFPLGYVADNSGLRPVAGNSPILNNVPVTNFSIAVSDDGSVYASFQENATKMSVASLSGGFSYVGEAAALPKSNSSAALIPVSSNDIWIAYPLNAATNGLAKRTLELAHYTAGWETEIAITPERPSSAYAYICRTVYAGGQRYLFIFNQNQHDVSLYRLNGQSWETVFESLKIKNAEGEDLGVLYASIADFDIASNGDVYMLLASTFDDPSKYNAAIIRYRQSTGQQTIIGGTISDAVPSTSSVWGMALDEFDTPYFIYPKDNTLYITHIDNKSKQWTVPAAVAPSIAKAGIAFGEDGTAYICGRNSTNGHVELYSSVN